MRKAQLLWATLVAACCLAVAEPARATMVSWSEVDTLSELKDGINASLCSSSNPRNCLQPMTQNACASGCPRRGFNYCFVDSRDTTSNCTNPASPHYKTRLDIHDLNEYLKALSKVATANPAATPNEWWSFGLTLEQMLHHQFQMMLRHPDVLYYDDALRLMAPGTYQTSNHTIDPTRFRMVAWVNESGIAHAMTQADLGLTFLKVAFDWALVGRADQIEYYLRMSRRAFESYSVRVDEGGVRNNHQCGTGWYASTHEFFTQAYAGCTFR